LRVVVVADTHMLTAPRARGRLPDAAWRHIEGADAILHAGDLLDEGVLAMLSEHAPVYAVLGNNDATLLGRLPVTRVMELDGVSIGMIHDSGAARGRAGRMRRRFPGAQAVVFGHSHSPMNEIGEEGQVLFNPGSPTQRRAQAVHTLGELQLADGRIVERRIIPLD
jgi:uncharacterized protein